MEQNNFLNSNSFKITIGVIGIIIIILLAFIAGVMVGFDKAGFSYQWGENYHKNFAGPKDGFGQGFMMGRDMMEGHGTFGQIIKIDGKTLIVKGNDNSEKIIITDDKTAINKFRNSVKVSDLKVDDVVVVIGSPNNSGQIEAKLIRVMPAPGQDTSSTSMMPPIPPFEQVRD